MQSERVCHMRVVSARARAYAWFTESLGMRCKLKVFAACAQVVRWESAEIAKAGSRNRRLEPTPLSGYRLLRMRFVSPAYQGGRIMSGPSLLRTDHRGSQRAHWGEQRLAET
jgi:hypothetical protein